MLLKLDGTLTLVGAPDALPVHPFSLIFKRRQFTGSLIGGISRDTGDAGFLRPTQPYRRR